MNSIAEGDLLEFDNKDNMEVFKKVIFEPIRIGPVSTLEEMDCKVLQFQNKKLETKLDEYQRTEIELQQRIEQLEKRQNQDKMVLHIVNYYWNQLNDDIKTMLLEFVEECYYSLSDEHNKNEITISFINSLSTWDIEVDNNLIEKAHTFTSALIKILRTYDDVLLRNDSVISTLKSIHRNNTDDVNDNVNTKIKHYSSAVNEQLSERRKSHPISNSYFYGKNDYASSENTSDLIVKTSCNDEEERGHLYDDESNENVKNVEINFNKYEKNSHKHSKNVCICETEHDTYKKYSEQKEVSRICDRIVHDECEHESSYHKYLFSTGGINRHETETNKLFNSTEYFDAKTRNKSFDSNCIYDDFKTEEFKNDIETNVSCKRREQAANLVGNETSLNLFSCNTTCDSKEVDNTSITNNFLTFLQNSYSENSSSAEIDENTIADIKELISEIVDKVVLKMSEIAENTEEINFKEMNATNEIIDLKETFSGSYGRTSKKKDSRNVNFEKNKFSIEKSREEHSSKSDNLYDTPSKEKVHKYSNSNLNSVEDGEMKGKSQIKISVLKELKNICVEINEDNTRLQNIISIFQDQYQESVINDQNIIDALNAKENEFKEWKILVDNKEYENEKLKYKKFKIEQHLSEAVETLENLRVRERNKAKCDSLVINGKKLEELEEDLKLHHEKAFNRSQELESLHAKYQNNLNTIEELEKNLFNIPDSLIEETVEYKCLQSQFSVLYNDTVHLKDKIEEYHSHIQTLHATFANKIEMTETEDLMMLKKLQTDLSQMHQVNSQLRKEYQILKVDFERNLIANEHTGPLNKEMRYLLVRLQKHNKHLKQEAQRYKRKYKEMNAEFNYISKQQSYCDSKHKIESEAGNSFDLDEADYGFNMNDEFSGIPIKDELTEIKKEKSDSEFSHSIETSPIVALKEESDMSAHSSPLASHLQFDCGSSEYCSAFSRKRYGNTVQESDELYSHSNKESDEFQDAEDTEDEKVYEDEYIQELKNQIKKAENEQKEMKLLLDTYKSVNRDKREKVQLLFAEKKLRNDIEDTKAQMRRIMEIKRENRKKLADEDALRKIKYLEDQNHLLTKQINAHKQEEEALLCEMEVTNQAFEDMQEQNSRLIQQLREKDDANSKLMAERIKSNLLYKITREERESLQTLIAATAKQLDSVTVVMNELESKEHAYQIAINNTEREINLRQQALELHKKRTLQNTQLSSEFKLSLDKYFVEIKEIRLIISDKSSQLDAETFRHNRLQEQIAVLRQRVKRMKKLETSESPDIVLLEEIREYKEMLTCQSCKVRRKDAVLTKCFHVFCWECLRTRYETRQRKCPKCNATFGANDYHRLFFAN